MTNRSIEYPAVYAEPGTPETEVIWLANLLAGMGREVTLANAQSLLATGLKNAPDKWFLTPESLTELWPTLVTEGR